MLCFGIFLVIGTIDFLITLGKHKQLEIREFPVSLYNQSNYVTITITGNANKKKASTETSEMYLDYIYLEPVNE